MNCVPLPEQLLLQHIEKSTLTALFGPNPVTCTLADPVFANTLPFLKSKLETIRPGVAPIR